MYTHRVGIIMYTHRVGIIMYTHRVGIISEGRIYIFHHFRVKTKNIECSVPLVVAGISFSN